MKTTLTAISLSLLAFTAGCTVVPGSGLPTHNKTVVYENNETPRDTALDSRINIYPITLGLIERMQEQRRGALSNPALDRQKSAYRYRVGSGDVLNVMVWHHPDLNSPSSSGMSAESKQVSNGVWVDEAGYLAYPLAGKIYARGKTLPELQKIITGRLKRYIKNPQVSLTVTEFRSQRVSVSGAVGKPGQFPITNVPLTLVDAIDQAGGAAENADTNNIRWTKDGVERTISLQDIRQHGDLSQNLLLSGGDIVYVPTTDNSRVHVMGEVGKQTSLRMGSYGLTLTQALGDAGGINQVTANASGVFVIRNVPEDRAKPIHVYQLNLKDASAYALANRFKLRADDVVYVTAAPVSRWNRVVSQVTNSVSNITSLNSSFN
ncbi:polysaccharide export protein [Neisseria zoodegmatis]|uniref:Capsule polysaccharide export outer membrane protein n=1 Tax=Neisseria zoodegmatis TaxID=326523 RepID=A0AB38DN06_9NEIS|nr:polysaccharide export protein [Neisseria zoodegmatis]OSI09392.1 polysaccharide export protein Wza [Neisseria zoodegmatis]SNU78626.1 capsule polysaccharide export outer membrane protein [Neisseria zoodegmatis]